MPSYGHYNRPARISSYVEPGYPPQYPSPGWGDPFGFGGPPGPPGGAPPRQSGGGFNFNDLKSMIDRLGGIDGILATMSKINKLMQTFQQMAPMMKLLFSSFGPKPAATKQARYRSPSRRRSSPSRKSSRSGSGTRRRR